MKPFLETSYITQVRRLRKLAFKVIELYSIKCNKLEFICHGENTTFKIFSNNDKYLLRIHRKNYHSENAILEELMWLKSIWTKTDIPVSYPIKSKNGKYINKVSIKDIPDGRLCDILHWSNGKIFFRGTSIKHFFKIGELTSKLHNHSEKIEVIHRNYWGPNGLLGDNAKFGSILNMKKYLGKKYNEVNTFRLKLLKKIIDFQNSNPDKLGLIHADLHFGNFVWEKGIIKPIDFDDCGFGFHAYDMAVTLNSAWPVFKKVGKSAEEKLKNAYFEGYNKHRNLTKKSIEMIPVFILVREMVMLGWLYDRSNNPILKTHLDKSLDSKIDFFRKQ